MTKFRRTKSRRCVKYVSAIFSQKCTYFLNTQRRIFESIYITFSFSKMRDLKYLRLVVTKLKKQHTAILHAVRLIKNTYYL